MSILNLLLAFSYDDHQWAISALLQYYQHYVVLYLHLDSLTHVLVNLKEEAKEFDLNSYFHQKEDIEAILSFSNPLSNENINVKLRFKLIVISLHNIIDIL